MQIICYPTSEVIPRIIPAPLERDWMGATDKGYPYRCLPLNIANTHGWVILNPTPFMAEWNGQEHQAGLSIQSLDVNNRKLLVESHFGLGVLTFRIPCLFRTEAGYDLWVGGPPNNIKDGIQPLTGIVESDWGPFDFTMNWKFTRPDAPVFFAGNEPICCFFPLRRGLLETVEPIIMGFPDDGRLQREFEAWKSARRRFNEDLKIMGSSARAERWQKEYFRGRSNVGEAPADHKTKLRVKEFAKHTAPSKEP